jgi:hypothetical protein
MDFVNLLTWTISFIIFRKYFWNLFWKIILLKYIGSQKNVHVTHINIYLTELTFFTVKLKFSHSRLVFKAFILVGNFPVQSDFHQFIRFIQYIIIQTVPSISYCQNPIFSSIIPLAPPMKTFFLGNTLVL